MKKFISIALVLAIVFSFGITAHALESNSVQLVTNGDTTFIVESNGTVKGWGRNQYGQVGIGSTEDQNVPMQIQGLSNIREIVTEEYGHGHFFAIDYSGNVYGWGYNGYGQLGLGHTGGQYTPVRIEGLPPVSKLILGGYTTYAITTEGDVYAWGRNDYGQVGNGTTVNSSLPQRLNLSSVRDIVSQSGTTFAITTSGDVYAWGRGDDYQLGLYDYIPKQTAPAKVTSLSNVDEIVTNGLVTYSSRHREPKRVSALSDLNETIDRLIIQNSTGFALTSDNTLYGWGYNFYNQLANGYTYRVGSPQPIPNLPKVKDFIYTGMTGIALCETNRVYTWGYNYNGQAGTGDRSRIGRIKWVNAIGENTIGIAGSNNTIYAFKADGSVYSWGSNYRGQAGIGVKSTIAVPTVLPDISGIFDIENVARAVYAMADNGTIYGWGENDYFQSDSDSRDDVLIPNVISTNQMFTAMGTGNVDSTVPITGNIDALEISITHPANIAYTIDPNSEDGFVCADIQIQNNSKVPVKVHVESFAANESGDIMFQDVLPDSMDWSALNREDTKKYIALGLQYVDETEWLLPQPDFIDSIFAVEIDHDYVGALYKNATGTLQLCGMHGLAFDGNYTANHDLIFVVSLL